MDVQVPRQDTTAGTQEVGQRRTQLPRMPEAADVHGRTSAAGGME